MGTPKDRAAPIAGRTTPAVSPSYPAVGARTVGPGATGTGAADSTGLIIATEAVDALPTSTIFSASLSTTLASKSASDSSN